MRTEIYAIYDAKAKVYNKPFHQINQDVAIRTASDLANDPNSEISKNPEDYVMFRFGYYDDVEGTFELNATPEPICKFHELVI